MNKKLGIVISGILIVSIIAVNTPAKIYASIFSSSNLLLLLGSEKKEEDIYKEKSAYSRIDLINEIMEIESVIKEGEEISLLPHAIALIDKEAEFSKDELINLLEDQHVGPVLEGALIKILIAKKTNNDELLKLIHSEALEIESKEYIVDLGDFSVDELSEVYRENDNTVAIAAMKRIMIVDAKQGYLLAKNVVNDDNATDSKLISAFLGLGEYYGDLDSDKRFKDVLTTRMKNIYSTSSNSLVKDNVIYSLSRMNDFEMFKFILDNKEIDLALKFSSIERNAHLMIQKISNFNHSESNIDDMHYIEKAMRLHPLIEVGDALKTAISKNRTQRDLFIDSDIIEYIDDQGIKGAIKYE